MFTRKDVVIQKPRGLAKIYDVKDVTFLDENGNERITSEVVDMSEEGLCPFGDGDLDLDKLRDAGIVPNYVNVSKLMDGKQKDLGQDADAIINVMENEVIKEQQQLQNK